MSTSSHTTSKLSTPCHDATAMFAALKERVAHFDPEEMTFSQMEKDIHASVLEIERVLTAQALNRCDVDAPLVNINGQLHRRAARCAKTYHTLAGPVRIKRTLYRPSRDQRSVAALDARAGIVERLMTPAAARVATWVTAHMTAKEAAEFFSQLGGLSSSKSTIDRLSRCVGEVWRIDHEEHERIVREVEEVPDEAAIVAVSADGIYLNFNDGRRARQRSEQKAQGKKASGPAGQRLVGCATLSLYDEDGERLQTRSLGQMPETKMATLLERLAAELKHVLEQRPDLRVVALADGAPGLLARLEGLIRPGDESCLDLWHALDHLHDALKSAYRRDKVKQKAELDRLHSVLISNDDGAERVIKELKRLCGVYPQRKTITRVRDLFKRERERMHYHKLRRENLPVGSGVVEAANKTLVTVRMKRAGARWSVPGGQAVLDMRALCKSGRFDRAWPLIAAHYRAEVSLPGNVLPFPTPPSSV